MAGQAMLAAQFVAAAEKGGMTASQMNAVLKDVAANSAIEEFWITDDKGHAYLTNMALSAVGIEIGPLIAGAGVVGVAVGFGAQTIVRDVISGIFYLVDDAFRVGDYIQSGSYKGTVESFSLRSVKLRHHRGPVHTVPFGSARRMTWPGEAYLSD